MRREHILLKKYDNHFVFEFFYEAFPLLAGGARGGL
jgi:hypothetical protein